MWLSYSNVTSTGDDFPMYKHVEHTDPLLLGPHPQRNAFDYSTRPHPFATPSRVMRETTVFEWAMLI